LLVIFPTEKSTSVSLISKIEILIFKKYNLAEITFGLYGPREQERGCWRDDGPCWTSLLRP
jgi:hypothetical protein